MANRRFTQFHYTPHAMPVLIDCNIAIGATGAVGTVKGPGVASVTRLAAGIYKIKLQDNYYKFYGMRHWLKAPVTGADVAAGSLTPGTVYEITALGTTTTAQWVTAGVPVGVTPAVGVSFLAAATSAGTGTAKAIGVSGIATVEVVGNTDTQLNPSGEANTIGGYVIVKCLGATDASTTTLIATDPAQGSILGLEFYLSNSSVVVQGE
jgi:hypothetical protein